MPPRRFFGTFDWDREDLPQFPSAVGDGYLPHGVDTTTPLAKRHWQLTAMQRDPGRYPSNVAAGVDLEGQLSDFPDPEVQRGQLVINSQRLNEHFQNARLAAARAVTSPGQFGGIAARGTVAVPNPVFGEAPVVFPNQGDSNPPPLPSSGMAQDFERRAAAGRAIDAALARGHLSEKHYLASGALTVDDLVDIGYHPTVGRNPERKRPPPPVIHRVTVEDRQLQELLPPEMRTVSSVSGLPLSEHPSRKRARILASLTPEEREVERKRAKAVLNKARPPRISENETPEEAAARKAKAAAASKRYRDAKKKQ